MELDIYYCLEMKSRIRYLIGVKGGITQVIFHNYAKMKVDSFDSLPLEKNNDFSLFQFLVKIKTTTTITYS